MNFDQNTIALLKHTINRYGWIDYPTYNNNMLPYMNKGNICTYVAFDSNNVKRGDVLLYHSSTGEISAHRVLTINEIDHQKTYELKGDLTGGIEEMVKEDQIIGRLTAINKKKKTLYTNDPTLLAWTYLISSLPSISKAVRFFYSINKFLQSKLRHLTQIDLKASK